MTFTIKADGKAVRSALQKFPVAYARESRKSLEEIAHGILANIKRRNIWGGSKDGKTLKKGLWAGDVRSSKGGAEIDTGWSGEGAAFGPGHEHGFTKDRWMVKPKNTRQDMMVSGRRIGQPIKALRFMVNGMVVYSKGHVVSAPRNLKPHWAPALKKFPVDKVMTAALDRAVKRAGLE